MFDSGSGENSGYQNSKIMYKVQEYTSLPVTLLLSHFHFDHNQNLNEFNQIAFPDLNYLHENTSAEGYYYFSANELFLGDTPEKALVTEWLPLETDIDLGVE